MQAAAPRQDALRACIPDVDSFSMLHGSLSLVVSNFLAATCFCVLPSAVAGCLQPVSPTVLADVLEVCVNTLQLVGSVH